VLELINKLYRQLAREGRTDTAGELRGKVQLANDRYDNLLLKIQTIVGALNTQVTKDSEFDACVVDCVAWLRQLDGKVAEIESRSADTIETRLKMSKV